MNSLRRILWHRVLTLYEEANQFDKAKLYISAEEKRRKASNLHQHLLRTMPKRNGQTG